jgi:hypothetical protein
MADLPRAGDGPAAEPDLADVQRAYPGWRCVRGISGFYYAEHTATGTQVNGEDPLDLRDQIKAAESRLACHWAGSDAPAGGGPVVVS